MLFRSVERSNYIEEASLKGITSQAYSYKFKDDGDYYLVIDNTDVPKGGESPLDQVDIKLKVSVVEPVTNRGVQRCYWIEMLFLPLWS